MRQKTWLADEVIVTVSGVLTTHHVFQTAAGSLGTLTTPSLKMTGTFRAADGRELTIRRTSRWRGTYELHHGTDILGTGRPLGLLRRENEIEFGDRVYRLTSADFWGRARHLLDAAAEMLLSLHPRSVFVRGATVRILQPVDLGLLVFTYHLVNARWKEQRGTVSACAAG